MFHKDGFGGCGARQGRNFKSRHGIYGRENVLHSCATRASHLPDTTGPDEAQDLTVTHTRLQDVTGNDNQRKAHSYWGGRATDVLQEGDIFPD